MIDIADVNSTSGLMKILRLREALLFQKLGSKMAAAAAGKAGVFDTWMLEESDLIQAAARAYGDRLIGDRYTLQNIITTSVIFSLSNFKPYPKNIGLRPKKISFFYATLHITHFFGLKQAELNGIISSPYPQVTLDAFGFPVGARSTTQQAVF